MIRTRIHYTFGAAQSMIVKLLEVIIRRLSHQHEANRIVTVLICVNPCEHEDKDGTNCDS